MPLHLAKPSNDAVVELERSYGEMKLSNVLSRDSENDHEAMDTQLTKDVAIGKHDSRLSALDTTEVKVESDSSDSGTIGSGTSTADRAPAFKSPIATPPSATTPATAFPLQMDPLQYHFWESPLPKTFAQTSFTPSHISHESLSQASHGVLPHTLPYIAAETPFPSIMSNGRCN